MARLLVVTAQRRFCVVTLGSPLLCSVLATRACFVCFVRVRVCVARCWRADECSCRCSNIFAHRHDYNPKTNDKYDAEIGLPDNKKSLWA